MSVLAARLALSSSPLHKADNLSGGGGVLDCESDKSTRKAKDIWMKKLVSNWIFKFLSTAQGHL